LGAAGTPTRKLSLECCREQVSGRQTAVGPPFLGDGQNLFLRWQVIEAVNSANGLAESEVAWQDDILAAESGDQGPLRRPRAYPGDLGQYRNELVVCHRGQRLRVKPPVQQSAVQQSPVQQALGDLAECADRPPGQADMAKPRRIGGQHVGGRRDTATEACLNALEDPPGGGDRQLLADDLEQQGTEQVHRRQLSHPLPRVEIRPGSYEPGQHRVSLPQSGEASLTLDFKYRNKPTGPRPSPTRSGNRVIIEF
jgi:hypothetical protein